MRRYSKQIVVVLTGHAKGTDELMAERPDLAARFPEIVFGNLTPDECLALLDRLLGLKGVKSSFFASEDAGKKFQTAVGLLSAFESWSNANDISKLARDMRCQIRTRKPRLTGSPASASDLPWSASSTCSGKRTTELRRPVTEPRIPSRGQTIKPGTKKREIMFRHHYKPPRRADRKGK